MTLEYYREASELTKKQFADKLGISTQFLHSLLDGKGNPSLPEAATLEEAARRAERVAGRERSEAEAMAREERTLRANPTARVQIDPNLPPAGSELREEHELLIDRLEAQKLTHTRVHRR